MKVLAIIVIIDGIEAFNRFALMGSKLASIKSGLPIIIKDKDFASKKKLPLFFPLIALELEDDAVKLIVIGGKMSHEAICEDILKAIKIQNGLINGSKEEQKQEPQSHNRISF